MVVREIDRIGVVEKAQPHELADIERHAAHRALVDDVHVLEISLAVEDQQHDDFGPAAEKLALHRVKGHLRVGDPLADRLLRLDIEAEQRGKRGEQTGRPRADARHRSEKLRRRVENIRKMAEPLEQPPGDRFGVDSRIDRAEQESQRIGFRRPARSLQARNRVCPAGCLSLPCHCFSPCPGPLSGRYTFR